MTTTLSDRIRTSYDLQSKLSLTGRSTPLAKYIATRSERKTSETEVIQAIPQGSDEEWVAWAERVMTPPKASAADLRVLALSKGKKIAPGTVEQHEKYLTEWGEDALGDLIRELRQFAIFGMWSDGGKIGPWIPLEALDIQKAKWLSGQATRTKYLKWFRRKDPGAYFDFVQANPSYRSQSSTELMD